MFPMKPVFSGATLAAAAAVLVISGATLPTSVQAADAKGQCVGANSCKGHGACKTAKNECKGQNSCKGQGFLELTKAECDKIKDAKFVPIKS
jgi:uncharacterized membrane protein